MKQNSNVHEIDSTKVKIDNDLDKTGRSHFKERIKKDQIITAQTISYRSEKLRGGPYCFAVLQYLSLYSN